MRKLFATLLVGMVLAACTKTEPEKEPAEQVIGTYDVDKITESLKFATSPQVQSQSLVLPFKAPNGDQLSASIDLAKKSSNIITAVYVENYTFAKTGKTETTRDAFDDMELKGSAGVFDLLVKGVKVGTVNNNLLTLEEAETGKDSLGRQYTYTFSVTAKKKQ